MNISDIANELKNKIWLIKFVMEDRKTLHSKAIICNKITNHDMIPLNKCANYTAINFNGHFNFKFHSIRNHHVMSLMHA